jgi:uncharacterized protein with von Willebrand factor type A (vWA) domain
MSFLDYLSPQRHAQHALGRLDSFDLQAADKLIKTPVAQESVDPVAGEYPPAVRLFQDAFLGLYKGAPRVKSQEEVTASHRLNQMVISQALEDRAFTEMRLRTRLDETMSLLGAANLWGNLMELLTDEQKRAARQAAAQEERAEQWNRQAEAAQALAEAAAQVGANEQAAQYGQQAATLQAQAEAARSQAESTMQQAMNQAPSGQAVHRAIKQAAQETAEQGDALNGWGLGPGAYQHVPPEERLALAERVLQSRKLRRLADLVGRFCNLAIAAQAEKTERVPGQIEGVELGNDVSRVLSAELAMLHHPVLRLDFYRRLAEGQLMQYRMTGQRRQALGPLVVCYDESGSMAGTKELWAKAVVLALLFVAKRQKRPFAAIAFGSAHEIRIKRIPRPDRATMEDILEVAEPFFNGGTDFHRPLSEAQQVVETGGHFERADIVFVTDGIAGVAVSFLQEFEAFKKRTGTRVFAVLTDVGQSAEHSVRRWADHVYRVVDLARDTQSSESAAKAVFGAV